MWLKMIKNRFLFVDFEKGEVKTSPFLLCIYQYSITLKFLHRLEEK
jgi:hypothetical protein